MSDIELMRHKLDGAKLTLFNNIVRTFEARIEDEKKRADGAEESLRRIRADFPMQTAKFQTNIKTKE